MDDDVLVSIVGTSDSISRNEEVLRSVGGLCRGKVLLIFYYLLAAMTDTTGSS